MTAMPRPRLPTVLAFFAAIASPAVLVVACGDDELRRGGQGASCERTDDCEPPLTCVSNVCGGPVDPPDGGEAGQDVNVPDVQGDGPSADGEAWSTCDECLDSTCAEALSACGDDCIAIEACVQMVCGNLSATGSADEGPCQVQCQNAHSAAKQPHLDVVYCAEGASSTCFPPCTPFPQDYDACRAFMIAGDCFATALACDDAPECNAYRDCIGTCSSLDECLACDDDEEGQLGRAYLELHEQCIAAECIAEAWLPNF